MGCLKYSLEPPVRIDRDIPGRSRSCSLEITGPGPRIVFTIKLRDADKSENYEICYLPAIDEKNPEKIILYNELARYIRIKGTLRKRLAALAGLRDDWDYYGAVAIESASVRNMRELLDIASAESLEKWSLFASTNGTLMLTARGNAVGSISIGNDAYSYALIVGEEVLSHDPQPFNAKEAAGLLKELSARF